MTKAELRPITANLAAIFKAYKICKGGETTLDGQIAMGTPDEGIAFTFQALEIAAHELATQSKALVSLVTKATPSTAPTLPTATTNSRKETARATVE